MAKVNNKLILGIALVGVGILICYLRFWGSDKQGREIGRFVLDPDPSALDSGYQGYSALSPDGKRLACARHNAIHFVNLEKILP